MLLTLHLALKREGEGGAVGAEDALVAGAAEGEGGVAFGGDERAFNNGLELAEQVGRLGHFGQFLKGIARVAPHSQSLGADERHEAAQALHVGMLQGVSARECDVEAVGNHGLCQLFWRHLRAADKTP